MGSEHDMHLPKEYRGKPLITRLPNHLTDEDVHNAMSYLPDYDESFRSLPAHRRKLYAETLKFFRKPLPYNLEIFYELMRTLRESYAGRDLFDPRYRQMLNEDMNATTANITGFSILGESGMGKTTTLEVILRLIPQVIMHHEYNGKKLSQPQVTWIRLECPYNKSLRTLCLRFFAAIDKKLGTTYHKKYSDLNDKDLVTWMPQVAAEVSLGVLIIDEIQRLHRTTEKGKQEMIDFFVDLSNGIGIPVILAGTPDSKELVSQVKAMARRFEAIYLHNLSRDGDFMAVLQQLWKFQYTNIETQLNSALIEVMWDETQGVVDTMIKLYEHTQLYVIGCDDETITPEIIRIASQERLSLTRSINKNGTPDAPKKDNLPTSVSSPVTLTGENLQYKERDMLAHTFITILKYPSPKAYAFADMLFQSFPGLDTSSLAQKGLELHSQVPDIKDEKSDSSKVSSRKTTKKNNNKKFDIDSLPSEDLRRIYTEGEKEGISTYDALKKANIIKSPKDLI